MISKIYLVTDLGPGDGGKGGIVHKLANTFHASVVLKFGGGQGSHGVVSDGGEEFAFSHWGCGTLEAIPTMITPKFTVIPHAILNEGAMLRRLGIDNPYILLSVDPRALCATPFHGLASQLYELARKDKPRGTVGTGAGEAYRLEQKFNGRLSLRMSDLKHPAFVRERLHDTIEYYQHQFEKLAIERDFLPEDQEQAAELLDLLADPEYPEWTISQYRELVATGLKVITLEEALRDYDGIAVAECSHGVLTDAECGFKPHVSAIRTLPLFAIDTLTGAGFTGKIVRLGITRAYAIRHGAGPLPTADDELRQRLLPHSHKDTNRWQGEVRVGAVDFNLLRYAVSACGGAANFDGLCVTCADQVLADGIWQYCDSYDSSGKAICPVGEELREMVMTNEVVPNITTIDCHEYTQQNLIEKLREVFGQQLGIPVRMVALGRGDRDKVLL